MKQPRIQLMAVISLLLLGTGCLAEPDWKKFDSQEGKFQVEMRGTPTHQPMEVPTDVGPLTAHNYILETNGGRGAYFVMYSDYPDMVLEAGPEVVLNNACNGSVQSSGLTVSSSEELEVEGGIGRAISARGKVKGQEMALRAHVYLYGNRLYQVMVVSANDLSNSADIEHFLGSFKVTQ